MKRAKNPYQKRDWHLTPVRTKVEVADILGISRAAVYQHEKSALSKLREQLEKKYGCDPQ